MFDLTEYKNAPESTLVRLNWKAQALSAARAKMESTKAFQAYKDAEYDFEMQKKDTVIRLKDDGVNFTVKAQYVTCAFIGSKSLDKESLEAFLKEHGASLAQFEKDTPYFRVTPK